MALSRRTFLSCSAAPLFAGTATSDVRIEELTFRYEDFRYRAPYKFGGALVDRVTLLNVECRVARRDGKSARGFAAMPMGNMWAFPAPDLSYETTLGAMKTLAEKISGLTRSYRDYAHPIEMNFQLEPEYLKAAAEIHVGRPVPKLCTLVTASPFDAALHDAYARLHGRNAFQASGKEFLGYDLSRYLGKEFAGEHLDGYVLAKPAKRILLYHSVGASDPLTAAEARHRVGDGLPETLGEWIRYNGLRALKIKLVGDDLASDVARVIGIDRVAVETQRERGVTDWLYSLDFNEKCPNAQYLLDFVRGLKSKAPAAFAKIQYVEQPTKRDLAADRANVMFAPAKLAPVVIDESLTGQDMLLLAREMGYTGVALKACKGQSQSLLMAAAAQKYGMFRCVQDLTCPGAALIQSAQLACHIPGVTAMEANAREYVPAANEKWKDRYPGLFQVKDGYMDTAALDTVGFGTL